MKSFDEIYARVRELPQPKVAVAVAHDVEVLRAVCEAHRLGLASPVLFGNRRQMLEIASNNKLEITHFEMIDQPDDVMATYMAVDYVHRGKADMFMKGVIDTATFLRAVLDRKVGLRTESLLSHVAVFEIPRFDRLVYVTDVAFVSYPTLSEKVALISNACGVARVCGIDCPRVAPLAAVEVVNPKMQATVDAAKLTEMCTKGQIKGCVVDGPLSFDLAMFPDAAQHKQSADRQIVGNADILLVPNIEAGNILYKCLAGLTDSRCGGILAGTKAPVVLTSRSDSAATKIDSIALAALAAKTDKPKKKR